MTGFGLIIDFKGILAERGQGVKARKLAEFQKSANAALARHWEQQYAPKHFESYAPQRYRLQKRAESTIKKKERLARAGKVKYGGRRALVHGGLLQQQMNRRGILRAYPNRLTLRKPSHVPRRPRFSTIDLHAEVTRVIEEERRALLKIAKQEFLRQLNSYRPRRRA